VLRGEDLWGSDLWSVLVVAFLLGLAGFATPVFAAPNYQFKAWQTQDDLPDNKIMAVLQTRDGYLWIGTYNGLARFDGVKFTLFDNGNTPEMHDSSVTSLFESEDGTLWIGHATGGVTRYLKGRFEAMEARADQSAGRIQNIGSDDAGDIWVLHDTGPLVRLRDGLVLVPQSGTALLLEMAWSPQGKIWVVRGGRLSQLERGKLTVMDLPGDLANSYVHGICASRDGGLWVASDGRLRKCRQGEWVRDLGTLPGAGTPLFTFIETRAGQLVAGTTDHGFYLISPETDEPVRQFDRANRFASDWVISLCEDREGGLWVGTGGAGLLLMHPGKVETFSPPDQWQGRSVLSVSPSREGGLWVGTDGAGLYRLHEAQWENFAKDAGIRNPYIWSVVEDAQGGLWAGTWGGSLYTRRGDRFERAPGVETLTTPMPAISCARQGGLWIGTGMGLMRYEAGQATWVGTNEDQTLRDVRTVIEDGEGAVWFGSYGGGLGCWKNNQIRQFRKRDGLSSDFIQCLHFDRDGALWIGTFGGGLNRLRQGRFAVIDRQQGLPDGVICHIEEDGRGYFWMSSHAGIIRVSKVELDRCADGQIPEVHCLTYGLADGLPTLKCSGGLQPAGCKTPDGRLWFATSNGLVALDPEKVATNPIAPLVVVESLAVDNRPVAEGAALGTPIRIPPGRHRFEFHYTGLSFVAPDKVRFKCRLEGMDTEWVPAGKKRAADYSYIPPGDYTFRVTACNNDGVWNEAGAAVAFTLLPFFWQTLWFRALAGAAAISATGGLVWYDTRRRMRRKLERLERQRAIEQERARIANEIHDDLGSHLTRITMLSETARGELNDPAKADKGLSRIYDIARELTRAMDEIVWAVNPKHDTMEGLVNYLEKFALDFLEMAGVRCRLEIPMEFPSWLLTSEARHNMFLAFKEALNNVVKHAGASEVRITLELTGSGYQLMVEDNGRGFVPDTRTAKATAARDKLVSGNGLENMRQRLTQIGGRCEIRSAPGQGTKVVFVAPSKMQRPKVG